MANNQPIVTPDADKDLEALRGKVPGIEEELDKGKEPIEEEEPADKEPDPKEPKEEEKADDSAPPKDDEGKEGDPDKEPADKPKRPERYIPIKQYTDEKKTWKGDLEEKNKRITELEGIVAGRDGSKKTDEAVKKYAEKYGVDEDSVRDLAEIIRTESDPAPKKEDPKKPEPSVEDQALLDEAREIKAEKLFNEEFTSTALPELKSFFPNAKPEQLAKAREELAALACTEKYLDKSLDFIVYKEQANLGQFFKTDRKGPEPQRQAPQKGQGSSYTAEDFKDGKTSFAELANLPANEQNAIVEKMDIRTYEKFSNWNYQNDDLVIRRGGKRIKP